MSFGHSVSSPDSAFGPNSDDAGRRVYAGRSLSDRKAERRERFRAAGLELFGTLGFADVTISNLCTEAGLSRRQFYEEYSGREELLTEIYDDIQQRARVAVLAAVGALDDADVYQIAHAAVDAYVDTVAADQRFIRCSFVEVGGVSEAVEKHRVASRGTWARFIADTISTLPGTADGPLDYTATAFIGALTSVVHRWSTADPRPDQSEIVDLLAKMLRDLATQ